MERENNFDAENNDQQTIIEDSVDRIKGNIAGGFGVEAVWRNYLKGAKITFYGANLTIQRINGEMVVEPLESGILPQTQEMEK